MKLYLGVTDTNWFRFLSKLAPPPEDINFWQPGGSQGFKVLPVGGPFLFKLKKPLNAVGGVGFFASYSRLPLSVAWETFGERNGTATYLQFRDTILNYRRRFADTSYRPDIGCIVLTNPVFFREEDWIEVPADWGVSIVQGKSYDTGQPVGKALWSRVYYTLGKYGWFNRPEEVKSPLMVREYDEPQYRDVLARVRVGQGAFRIQITDTYRRRCAVTGERTLPALEAAHIKPYAQSGPHAVPNGLLLRSDLHKLFDSGYLSITPDYRLKVSDRIREEFENGKDYYRYKDQSLLLPDLPGDWPAREFLDWHSQKIFQ